MKVRNNVLLLCLLSGFIFGCSENNTKVEESGINYNESSTNIVDSGINYSESGTFWDESGNLYENSSIESSITEEVANSNVESVIFKKHIKLYINPSVQYNNAYAANLGNEGERMNEISNILEKMFVEHTNIDVYSNNDFPGLSLTNSVKQSNDLSVDYHLALHSNAGGGIGSEGWYTKSSYDLTKSIINSLQNVLPYPTRGLKDGSKNLYELKNTKAPACLIEILFHDNEEQAKYLIDHENEIAESIYNGVINYFKKI